MRGIDRKVACIDGCHAIAIKSCNEFEGKFIDYFQRVTGKPVIPVGPLLQSNARPLDSECLKWLGRQAASSVVYASFGTECFLSNAEVREVALGLEASGHPFILVFMEEMSVGLPLIALPMLWDQGLNARLIDTELKVGVEVAREADGGASTEDICRGVRAVMAPEERDEGKEVRQRASQMGEAFRKMILNRESCKGSEERYVDKFVQQLLWLASAKGGHGCH